jgi:hypothetical protein
MMCEKELSRYVLSFCGAFILLIRAVYSASAKETISELLGKKYYYNNKDTCFVRRCFYLKYFRILPMSTKFGLIATPTIALLDLSFAIASIPFDIYAIEIALFSISVLLITLAIIEHGKNSKKSSKTSKEASNSIINTLILVIPLWIFLGYFIYEYFRAIV